MWMSLLTVAACSIVGGYTYATAQFRVTRRVAQITLLLGVAELILCGLLTTALPLLQAVLWVLRLTILACCVGACRADRRASRRRAARRAAYRRQMRCAAHPLQLVAAPSRDVARCA